MYEKLQRCVFVCEWISLDFYKYLASKKQKQYVTSMEKIPWTSTELNDEFANN